MTGGVPSALPIQALHQWITGDITTDTPLSARARAAKAGYGELPSVDMAALIVYLHSLPEPTTPN